MAEGEIESADDLYGLEPGQFVAARAALVKKLKAAGEKEAAAEVGALRKPSAGAWALNQVARSSGDLVVAALEAGAALRAATDAAVGGDNSGIRAATTADRKATDAVVDAAAKLLGPKGVAAKHALAATVRSAVLDDVVAEELRAGTLTVEHDGSAFGFGFGLGDDVGGEVIPFRPREKKAPKPKAKSTKGGSSADDEAAAEAQRAADEEAARAAAEAAEAEEREREARRRRTELEEKVKKLERRAERLAEVAEKAEEAAREAREDADDAAAAVEAAKEELAEA